MKLSVVENVYQEMEVCQQTLAWLAGEARLSVGGGGGGREPVYRYFWVETGGPELLVHGYPQGDIFGQRPLIYCIRGREITGPSCAVPAAGDEAFLASLFARVRHQVDALEADVLLKYTTPARAAWWLAIWLNRPDRIPQCLESILHFEGEEIFTAAYVQRWQQQLEKLYPPKLLKKVLALPLPQVAEG